MMKNRIILNELNEVKNISEKCKEFLRYDKESKRLEWKIRFDGAKQLREETFLWHYAKYTEMGTYITDN